MVAIVTVTHVDVEGEQLANWVEATGVRLSQTPREPVEVVFAHVLSGFLAIGRAALQLTAISGQSIRASCHDVVFNITADAEVWIVGAVGAVTIARNSDRGEHLYDTVGDTASSPAAQRRLQHAAYLTASTTHKLLTGLHADPALTGSLRALVRNLATGAGMIADLYGEAQHSQHIVSKPDSR
jgi:hypothetical protein